MKSSKEKRALIAGMIGCLLYVIGDFLFAATGKSQSTESIGLMVKVAYLDTVSYTHLVSAGYLLRFQTSSAGAAVQLR